MSEEKELRYTDVVKRQRVVSPLFVGGVFFRLSLTRDITFTVSQMENLTSLFTLCHNHYQYQSFHLHVTLTAERNNCALPL